jgi:hypothetical protein
VVGLRGWPCLISGRDDSKFALPGLNKVVPDTEILGRREKNHAGKVNQANT